MKNFLIISIIATISASCSKNPYKIYEKEYKKNVKELSLKLMEIPSENGITWIPSINFGIRKPNYVLIHHTAQDSLMQTISTFQNKATKVSSHYVIGRDGKVVQMLNDYTRAHHAGKGKWGNDTDLNSSSIGIEMDNNGVSDPWPDVQIAALLKLLENLKSKYSIPQLNFLGHADFAPGRKIDPYCFPWQRLAEKGFGVWFDENLETPPQDFKPIEALRIIGYDVSKPEQAIKSFKIHYIQSGEQVPNFNEEEMKILYCIYKKYL